MRTRTFLFTDLEGSTHLWQHYPEAMRSAQARHDALLKKAVEGQRGWVVKTTGDGLLAAFRSASDAIAAALAGQRAMLTEAWPEDTGPLKVRMGIHTGESEEREGDYFGSEVNRAARLMSIGHGGQVLVSGASALLVRNQLPPEASLLDLGEHGLRDLEHPENVFQLAHPDLPSEFAPLRSLSAYKHNLPAQPSSFVGRKKELAEIADLLTQSRLITLVGPGGTGKTRLALQVAAEELDVYDDGAFFVDLTLLNDPSQIVGAIAETLGVRELSTEPLLDTLERYLQDRRLLLVVDNFEHLMPGTTIVGDLIAAAPQVDVLVTSREVLRLSGESTYPVPPLRLPEPGQKIAAKELADYEAVALFIRRAKAAKHRFEITEQNASAVAEICRQLDGLPLAIELAAARTRMFPPAKLLERLSDRLKLLRGGVRDLPARQQTLRGTIDWSYDLLDEAERTLFARLAVFSGGGSLEAIEAVCGDELGIEILEGLESLLDKSLIRQEEDFEGQPRFAMLETIHAYARERLRESGEVDDLHRRHAEHFTALAERAEPHTRGGPDQMRWLRRLEADHHNLRAMYRWSMGGGEVELGLRLVGALGYFWWRQGHYAEGQQWTDRALGVMEGAPPAVRAGVFSAAGRVAFYLGDSAASKHALGEAQELYRELGNQREIGWILVHLAMQSLGRREEYEDALALAEEGLALLREADDRAGITQALTNLGELARLQEDLPRAKGAYEECLNVAREIGDRLREGIVLTNLGLTAQQEGDAERAHALFKQALTLALEIGHLVLKVDTLAYLAGAAGARGQLKRAARLFGASEALYDRYGFSLQVGDMPDLARGRASVREQLDEGTFNTLWAEGEAMSLEEAIAYALEEPASDS